VPLNLSFTHIMVVLIVALIVLGPEKLPDAARSIARVIGELRRMSSGLQAEVRDTFGDFAEPFSELVHAVAGGVADATSAPAPPLATPAAAAPPLEALPMLASPAGPFAAGPPVVAAAAAGPSAPAAGTFMARPGSDGDAVIPPLGSSG
jgi:sec-independent protein translocase protein TatB